MYQTIHEAIAVAGVYKKAIFTPHKFLWQKKIYPIDELTFVTDIRDGKTKKRRFSLVSGGNSYHLLFDRDRETWMLEEIWCD